MQCISQLALAGGSGLGSSAAVIARTLSFGSNFGRGTVAARRMDTWQCICGRTVPYA